MRNSGKITIGKKHPTLICGDPYRCRFKKTQQDFMLVCERHPELEKCRQLAAFKYLERKSQLPNEALIGIVLFCPRILKDSLLKKKVSILGDPLRIVLMCDRNKRIKGEKKTDSPMKAPVTETIRHVVINLVPYHINGISKILPYEDYNDNRDRNHENRDRRQDYHRNDRDNNRRDGHQHGRNDRYDRRDDHSRDRYDRRNDRPYERNDRHNDRNDRWRDNDRRGRYGRGGNRGHGDRGGKRPWIKKPETKYLPNYHKVDSQG